MMALFIPLMIRKLLSFGSHAYKERLGTPMKPTMLLNFPEMIHPYNLEHLDELFSMEENEVLSENSLMIGHLDQMVLMGDS